MKDKIVDLLESDVTGTISLCQIDSSRSMDANLFALNYAGHNHVSVIYVMTKYPFTRIRSTLDKVGVSSDASAPHTFIDCITKIVSNEVLPQDNALYLDGPQELVNLGTSISVAAEKLDYDSQLLIIDSFDTLLTYNSPRNIIQFLKNLKERMSTLELNAVFFYDKTGEKHLTGDILEHIDRYVLIHEGNTETAEVDHESDDYVFLRIPKDVSHALEWEIGNQLDFDVNNDGTLELHRHNK